MNDWVWLLFALGLLLMILMGVMFLYLVKIVASLRRLEGRMQRADSRGADAERSQNEEKSEWDDSMETADSAFDRFMLEDASRRHLPKREQFEAYRRWRQENGMNWNGR
jgi:hypothetical protein